MREKIFKTIMKAGALLNIFIFFYPVSVLLRYLLYEDTGGIPAFIFSMAAIYIGWIITALICKNEFYFTTRLMSYGAVIIPGLVCALFYSRYGLVRSSLEIIYVSIMYFVGSLNYPKGYKYIFTSQVLYLGTFLLSVALLITSFIGDLSLIKNVIFILIVFFILISMVLKSVENIDKVFLFRGVEIPEVQRSIRKQNFKYILLLFCGILTLLNIKQILTVIVKFVLFIYFKVMLFLLKYLATQSQIVPDDSSGKGKSEASHLDIGNSNKMVDYLFIALFVILSIYIIYKAVPKIIKGIRSFIAYLKKKFSTVIKLQENNYNDDECVEIVEITKQSERSSLKRKSRTNLYSLLKKASDPTEKIRLMYRIVIKELSDKAIKIVPSDTPEQIAGKTADTGFTGEDMKKLTNIYEKVRYGEVTPENEDIKSMDGLFSGIIKTIKK